MVGPWGATAARGVARSGRAASSAEHGAVRHTSEYRNAASGRPASSTRFTVYAASPAAATR
jgi:hypothetical protein